MIINQTSRCHHCGLPIELWEYTNTETGERDPMRFPTWMHSAYVPYRECKSYTVATPRET